jgi:urease accessory protein UreF
MTALAWFLLGWSVVNLVVSAVNIHKADELDKQRIAVEVTHLRNLAWARLLDAQAKHLGGAAANEPIREVRS